MANQVAEQLFLRDCDVWFFPTPEQSRWLNRLDWYLNWQLSRALAHAGLQIAPEVMSIAQQFMVNVPQINFTKSQLMASGIGLVPAKCCVVIVNKVSLTDWLSDIGRSAQSLKAKKIHIFLPQSTAKAEAMTQWQRLRIDCEAEFSMDAECETDCF